jgi:hypothetical protein
MMHSLLTGYEVRDRTCAPPKVSQKRPGAMHAPGSHALLYAVEALIHGRCLILMDLARFWRDGEHIRALLKAL